MEGNANHSNNQIPIGRNRAKAVSWGFGTAQTGTQQVGIEFELLDVDGKPHITWYGFFTEKALPTTIKALRACGWEGCELEHLDGLDAREVQLVIEEETDNEGHPRLRVRWVNSAGGLAMGNPLEGNDLKAFSAKMRGAILGLDPNNAAKCAAGKTASKPAGRPATQRQPYRPATPEPGPVDSFNPPPPDDSDIPF